MTSILFIEDDLALGFALEFSLKDEGFKVERVTNLKEAKDKFSNNSYDLILLDVNLPDGTGYDFCKYIREKSSIPVIFLTALDEEVNIVMGLEIGGNDYLTKPFGFRELLARIKVQLRKSTKTTKKEKMVSGDITIDLSIAQALKKDKVINLTQLEYKLLSFFMNNPLKPLEREEILKNITSDEDCFFDENTLSVYIKRLREKLEDNPKEPKYIITQRGVGYKWNEKVRDEL